MNQLTDLTPYIFGAITLAGVLYFLYSIIFGEVSGDGGPDLEVADDAGKFGCTIIAAFLAAFGAVGLLGTLSNWGLPLTLGASVVFGLVIGRIIMAVLAYVVRQQSTERHRIDDLIGVSARVTIDTPAGATGEAMVETAYVSKYPVRDVTNSPLSRGDYVEVVDVRDGTLYVKKKRQG
ncbi:MAG: hypothetical protein DIU68_010130 [Chloroflexota bacterium]|nr:MAG: hypothetical protein DIU68_14235 [Chloroflexota bacterium]